MQLVPKRTLTPVVIRPMFTPAEEEAVAGFLAGYRGLTGEAYQLDRRH